MTSNSFTKVYFKAVICRIASKQLVPYGICCGEYWSQCAPEYRQFWLFPAAHNLARDIQIAPVVDCNAIHKLQNLFFKNDLILNDFISVPIVCASCKYPCPINNVSGGIVTFCSSSSFPFVYITKTGWIQNMCSYDHLYEKDPSDPVMVLRNGGKQLLLWSV